MEVACSSPPSTIAEALATLSVNDNHAFEIRDMGAPGQGVFACRRIGLHETIANIPYPISTAISFEKLNTTCYSCLIPSTEDPGALTHPVNHKPLKRCGGCDMVWFCNQECQARAWHAYHKYECKLFKKHGNRLEQHIIRAFMRPLVLREKGIITEQQWQEIMSLVSHQDRLDVDDTEDQFTRVAAKSCRQIIDMVQRTTKSTMDTMEARKLFYIIKTNQMELVTSTFGHIGLCMDPLLSKFNHSCNPNAMVHRPYGTMSQGWLGDHEADTGRTCPFGVIIPTRDIEQGEELCITYDNLSFSVEERNAKFKRSYFFECMCDLCGVDRVAALQYKYEEPELLRSYRQWLSDVLPISHDVVLTPGILQRYQAGRLNAHTLQIADKALGGIVDFVDYPALYTTGDFPIALSEVAGQAIEFGALDVTLINYLRTLYLVEPARFSTRLNHWHTTRYGVLEAIDILLGVTKKRTFKAHMIRDLLLRLSRKGIGKGHLVHWRNKACKDFRLKIEGTASKDLLVLIAQYESRMNELDSAENVASEIITVEEAELALDKVVGICR